ncbi:MAG: glycoside hydrolase family 9 protein [Chitinispirillaceae bacterium]|nr:glycoside hydrolase family 9 protein [Chitinispirillaceae bacterium]
MLAAIIRWSCGWQRHETRTAAVTAGTNPGPDRKTIETMKRFVLAAGLLCISAMCLEVAAVTLDSLHAASIRFYGFQRAGTKSGNPHNPFYSNTPYPHANDAHSGTALDGGWYDAGDFVKFGLPLGYATYCLLKGYDAFPEGYDDKTKPDYSPGGNTIPDILDEAKVATDWLCKAIISSSTIVRDVGDANADHMQLNESGYQNSSRIPNRTSYLCDGADVPGYYAAALALMSILYKQFDAAYATTCLNKAKIAYAFGKSKGKVCGAQIMSSENRPFYVSETWKDKMACGGVELFRATGDSAYLREARTYISDVGQHYSNLGYPHAGDLAGFTFYRLGETSYASTWKLDVNYGAQRIVPVSASGGATLVRGAFVNQTWGVASCAAAFGFSTALLFRCVGDNSMRDIAFQQLNWATGTSPFSNSYMTRVSGGSSAGVQNPHHRNDVTLGVQTGRRIVGSLVSGPSTNANPFDPLKAADYSWNFSDNSSNYVYTEPALDYNAGLVGLIAFKRWYDKSLCERIDSSLATVPLGRIDFTTTQNVTIKATLEKSLSWTIDLKGRLSGAARQFTGSGTRVSATWNGTAATGTFQSGENVDITLSIANMCDYCAEKSRSVIFIDAMPEGPIPASAVKVDDFEDNNTTNALQGIWEGFSDRSDSLQGGMSAKPTLLLVTGKGDAGKGLQFRLTATTGVPNPYAGVKTYFNAQRSAVSIGSTAKSIIFDINPTATGKEYRVELEQPDITDRAYYGATLQTGMYDRWVRMVVPLSSFAQPDWKTVSRPLNKGNITSIRFVMYGAGNSSGFIVDNVYVDSMRIGTPGVIRAVPLAMIHGRSFLEYKAGTIRYEFPFTYAVGDRWETALYSATGRQILRRTVDPLSDGLVITLSCMTLPPGCYVLAHFRNGVAQKRPIRFVAAAQ